MASPCHCVVPPAHLEHTRNHAQPCQALKCSRCLPPQVQQTLKRGSAIKRALAGAFLAIGGAYIRAKRITQGTALQYAVEPRPVLAYLWALVVATVLAPLHK